MDVFALPQLEDNERSTLKACDAGNGGQPQLSDVWRDIQGADNWNGLLDPVNPILKAEALRYGDLAQLCYDAFDGETYSIHYGTYYYSERDLFKKMGISEGGYQVTKYIYANTNLLNQLFSEKPKEKGVWIGFIAVCTDPDKIKRMGRRDIVITWRGTQTTAEWIQDLRDILVPTRLSYRFHRTGKDNNFLTGNEGVLIERGFLSCYTSNVRQREVSAGATVNISTRDLVFSEIERLLQVYENEMNNLSITFTGHSLGAALATLSAYDVKQLLGTKNFHHIPVTVFAFASPRVGNLGFAKRVEEIGVKVLRFVNKCDVVPKVPGVFVNENLGWLSKLLHWLPWTYFHVGVHLVLDEDSPAIVDTPTVADFHNLELYLHYLDRCGGTWRRDPALVNKRYDLLREEYKIPPNWWQKENKGLIKGSHGEWKQPTKSGDQEDNQEE